MKLESLRLHNFRAFQDTAMKQIPNFCILVGANGTGKSTIFSVFEFLKNAMTGNINTQALLHDDPGILRMNHPEAQSRRINTG